MTRDVKSAEDKDAVYEMNCFHSLSHATAFFLWTTRQTGAESQPQSLLVIIIISYRRSMNFTNHSEVFIFFGFSFQNI